MTNIEIGTRLRARHEFVVKTSAILNRVIRIAKLMGIKIATDSYSYGFVVRFVEE